MSAGSTASDSNNGLSWGGAFATIAAAVTALGSAAGVIHVGSGTFPCNVSLNSSQTIEGSGEASTTLQSANNANADVIKGAHFATLTGTNQNGAAALATGDNFVTVRDCVIDGNKSNNTAGFGIRLWGRGYRFRNIIVQNCANDGIWTEFAQDISSFIPTNWIEGHSDSVFSLNNGGNGWTDYGPHDSVRNRYEAFGNGGWGFYNGSQSIGGTSATLAISGATGGTFYLWINGVATGTIAYNATAAAVQTAITAIPGMSGVTCSGGPIGTGAVTINFPSGVAYHLLVNPVALQGASGQISVGTTSGTVINNGATHGSQWNCFENALGGVFGGQLLDVDACWADGNSSGAGIGLVVPPGAGSYTIRGSAGGATTGAIVGGSNHHLILEVNGNTGDAFQDAGVGASIIELFGSVPNSGNCWKGYTNIYGFAISGSCTVKARVSLGSGATLSTGFLNSSFSLDMYGAGATNPNEFQFPGSGFFAVGWNPKFPQSNGVLMTIDSTATTATAGTATLPANPDHFIVVKDSNGTSWKLPAYAV